VDKRADLWALGVILHEMLTGQRPFHGEQAITVAQAIVHNDPERPSALRAGISDRADALVQTLLRKDPAQRCASAEDMIAALDAISADAQRHHSSSGADGYGRAKRARLLGAFAARIRPYVTRRRAAWGVAFGVGVLAILLVGFTVSRALGIGPAASLFSTGKLSPSDSILVADFDIPGTDSSNRVMALLVRTALSQSNVVTVVQDVTIRAALQRMRLSATTPLVSAVARALAQREGFKAVVEGTLTPLGAGFMVTLGLVSAEGDHLFSVQETADLNSLVPTIERLTRKLRGRIGESLEHVRASPSLPRVTSYSIAALRKYEEGNRALNEEANHILAVQLLNEAVDLDSTFAMAWVSLTAAYRNGGYPQDRWHYALERGYRNRERLPLSERYSAEGMYFRVGPGRDRDRAAQAYAKGLLIDTGSFANSLGLLHQSRREYARAESLFRWYVDRGSNLQVAYENLSNALYFQGKKEESESVEAVRSGRFDSPRRWGLAAGYLYNRGQLDSAELMLERYRAEGDATHRGFAWYELSGLSLVRGRLGEAERARDQAGETNLARDVRRDSVAEELGLASRDVWHRGRRERGLARLDRILAQTPLASLPLVSALNSEPYYLSVARIFARARRPDRAREVLGQFLVDRRDTLLLRISEPAVHSVRGEIALAEGRPLDALQEFRRADRLPDGPIHLMALGLHADVGRAFDQAGMVDSAITSFEQYLETPQLLRLQYDAVYMPHILQRLGALYEAKGDREKAIGYYERFVELWRNADPELQPRVAEARRRIELLRGGSGAAATVNRGR
jgi:tetratricopeptide (TPR) repeat protein